MLVTLWGIVMDVRPVQFKNAPFPILTTLSGIAIVVSPVQPEKALLPIIVTESPKDTYFKLSLQYSVTLFGVTFEFHKRVSIFVQP